MGFDEWGYLKADEKKNSTVSSTFTEKIFTAYELVI